MSLSALRTVSSRRVSLVAAAGPSSVRCISSTSAVAAPKKKKRASVTVVHSADAMPLADAVRTLRALEIANPSSAFSIEVTTKVSNNPLRGRVALPSDPRRVSDTILVFANPDSPAAQIAREAGAKYVGSEELFNRILTGEIQPTKVLSTPAMIPAVTKSLARFLGPKGLMPATKRGTVGDGVELGKLVKAIGGTLDWKADKLGLIRAPVGRLTFTAPQVEENVRAFLASVRETAAAATAESDALKRGTRASSILRTCLDTTQGPSIELKDL